MALSIEVFDANKKAVGKADLNEAAFGAPVKKQLLWEVVRQQQAKTRAGTASTKKRGDVSGGRSAWAVPTPRSGPHPAREFTWVQ